MTVTKRKQRPIRWPTLALAFLAGCAVGRSVPAPMAGPPAPATATADLTLSGRDGLVMHARLFLPAGAGPFAAALLLPGGRGAAEVGKVWRHHLVFAEQLAQRGVAALVLDYHSDDRALQDPRTLFDLGVAIEALKAQAKVRADRLFLIGFSMGGTNALRVAVERSDIAGLVTFFAPLDLDAGGGPRDAVARLACPVLILQGGRDAITSPEQARGFAQVLREHGKQVELAFYPRAGHGFTYVGAPLGACCNYDVVIAARALDAVVAFLRSH